ncbi:DUF4388 domain-containing protein [Deinococcus yavapaiensis]|uniref:DUF4388 domain-containing protein n=1 Tax=Deinococcus yavapaiensis KR-236 TaxID=694435 RepID=A0A318S0V8_9DEIO|nr:DUF4388 domain-containing protein [Deinococcus yavapaiensis]PYE50955.1 hypothetical protein DES52_11622 [Deinococcus yavapaiensis KR-236]
MALTGDLTDLPLTDLTQVLAHHTGTLDFDRAFHGRNLQLILERGRLRALFVDGFDIRDDSRLQDVVRTLATTASGAWEFHAMTITDALRHVDYILTDLLHHVTHPDIPDDHLPHPRTTFVPTRQADVPLELQSTWTTILPFVQQGASAHVLASNLSMSERDAQLLLYRLRAVNVIQPSRYTPENPTSPHRTRHVTPTSSHSPERPAANTAHPITRLLGALRRIVGARA